MLPFHDLVAAEPSEIFTNATIHTLGLEQELYMIADYLQVTVYRATVLHVYITFCDHQIYQLFPTTYNTFLV